ncbi:MAG: flavin reductase [SAR86 cluster bacterium]|uniref:Flavin reductase n=1 Tax=SAR86 cluster bacterium TaxID=2030880 RepID=A0A2A5B1R5_9GAMM|nr:MAG: flavin reductase [SAR86 cluster bacterium]
MFYEPHKKNHGLAKSPFNSLIIPRPIGWISSIDNQGVFNLAPYSFFNAVCYQPPTVMFSAGVGSGSDGMKDTLRNIEANGEFVCNLATWENREQMNKTSANVPADADEIELAGLTAIASKLISVPRIAEAPVHLECRYIKSVDIPTGEKAGKFVMVLGEVIGVHIRDELITADGLIDVAKMRPIGRLGYDDYTCVNGDSIFSMERPT